MPVEPSQGPRFPGAGLEAVVRHPSLAAGKAICAFNCCTVSSVLLRRALYHLPSFSFLLGLFSALDIHSNLGVISYGVSMTTLEDVFLKLEVEAEIDQAGKNRTKKISQ